MNSGDTPSLFSGKKRPASGIGQDGRRRRGNDSALDNQEMSNPGSSEQNAFASLEALLTGQSRFTQATAQKSAPSSPSSLSSNGTSESPKTKVHAAKKKGAGNTETPLRSDGHCSETTVDSTTNRSGKKIPRISQTTLSIVGSRPRHWTKGKSKRNPVRRGFAEPNKRKRQACLEAELNRPPATSPLPASTRDNPERATLLPTFLSRDIAPEHDDIQEATEELVGTEDHSTGRTASPVPVTPKRSSKKGPLAKRMQSLRDSAKGDQIRLQSGQYPFSLRSNDRNDPRNRATSTATVTVLGTPVQLHRQVVSVLCYLHAWESVAAADADVAGINTPPQKSLVWVIFRSGPNQPKGQLRLYNVIATPCKDKWVLFHTDVREPYPAQLPALEAVPAVSPTS